MMKKPFVVAAQGAFLALALISCNEKDTIIDHRTGQNVPIIVNTLNTFSYYINAKRATARYLIPVQFTHNRLQVSATLSGEATGRAVFVVRNQAQEVIRADTFTLPGVYTILSFSGIPASVTVSLADFTGSLTYVLLGVGNFDVMTLNQFPTRTGSQWTYAVYDSLARQSDTLVVTIFGQRVLPGNIPAWIWQLAYRSRTDTQYVSISGDTVRFYLGSSTWSQPDYQFPLWLGKSWNLAPRNQTSVPQVGWVGTPAGSFPNAYLVEKRWAGHNDYGTLQTWLVPNIGIVKLHRRGMSFGHANVLWELIGYRITR